MRLTKPAVAERESIAAGRLLFDGGDPIAVCLLPCAVRDIASMLCEKRGLRPFLAYHPHPNKADLYKVANRLSNFLKHANNDPNAVLDDFEEADADCVLYLAAHD